MRRRFGWSVAWLACASGAVACATYDGLPTQMDQLGNAGSSGMASEGGTTLADMTSAGKTSTAGKQSGGNGGGGGQIMDGGGDAGTTNTAGNGGLGGAAGSGGMAAAGNGGSGGTTGGGGTGGAGGKAGSGGMAGAGGAASGTTTSPDASCSCLVFGGHDYWFCTTFLTFAAAENKCKARGMHLPKVESQAEDDFLYNTGLEKVMGEYYLGGTDATVQDTWTWLAGGTFWTGVANGTASGYVHWGSNEPNASGDCLVVQSNDVWDDRICTDGRKYICEGIP